MTEEKTIYNIPWAKPENCCKQEPKDSVSVKGQDSSHPELGPDYFGGDGVCPVAPSQLPELLARYFANKGEDRPMFSITQIAPTVAWQVKCKVDGLVCIAQSAFRKTAREVCAAMIFKQLGLSNEDLVGIHTLLKVEPSAENELPDLKYLPDNSDGRFPTNAAELTCFCENFFLGTGHQIFNLLNKSLICKGYHTSNHNPTYFITQYVDCTETRSGDCGWWTVTCVAESDYKEESKSLSYKVEGNARMLTKQLSAAGILILLGVTKEDALATKKGKVQKRMLEQLRQEDEEMKSKRASPEPSEQFAKAEPFQLAKAEPFQLAKAEPFQLAKAEPIQLAKAEPIQLPKAEPFAFPVVKAEPFPVIKAEPFPVIKAEPFHFPVPPVVTDFDSVKLEHS